MTKARYFAALATALITLSASAQVEVRVNAPAGSFATPIVPVGVTPGAASLVSPLSSLSLTPTLSAPSITPAIALDAPAALAPISLTVAAAPQALTPLAVKPAALTPESVGVAARAALNAKTQASPLSVLTSAASVSDEKPAKLDATFDGSAAHTGEVDAVVTPAANPRRSFLGRAALAAGIWIAHPGIALAASGPVQRVVEPGAMALVSNYSPLAVAIAAVLGALFGLWSARGKDGAPANAGAVFSGALSHGAIAGAAAFTLLDLTQVAFLGTSAAALTPLTAALATAALAQAAFAAKFVDPATTPADRVIGAFPAIAMAFGLSVGAVAFLPAATTMLSVGTAALMATGAMTALFTAIFRLEKSPATGPALMGRGFVLQALMTGMALALGTSLYAPFFFALGMAGFAIVAFATGREVWSVVKSLLNPPPPPAPKP